MNVYLMNVHVKPQKLQSIVRRACFIITQIWKTLSAKSKNVYISEFETVLDWLLVDFICNEAIFVKHQFSWALQDKHAKNWRTKVFVRI